MGICIGFDLDMTLIDPRPGMVAAMKLLSEQTGYALDGEYFAAHLGPPLQHVLREFDVPEDRIPETVERFRVNYPEIVVPQTIALPGAMAALEAVKAAGGSTLVVTGKYGPNADLHAKALEFPVDTLVGDLWAAGKATALREHDARAYVGDYTGDMVGAREAGAYAVGVATGPCTRDELVDAGADVVFDSLTEFPAWLRGWLAS